MKDLKVRRLLREARTHTFLISTIHLWQVSSCLHILTLCLWLLSCTCSPHVSFLTSTSADPEPLKHHLTQVLHFRKARGASGAPPSTHTLLQNLSVSCQPHLLLSALVYRLQVVPETVILIDEASQSVV